VGGTPAAGEVDWTDYSVVVVAVVVKLAVDQMNSPKYFAELAETQGPVSKAFTCMPLLYYGHL
jgi:hypothetical protein